MSRDADEEAVLWARTLLLGSRGSNTQQQVEAYRVLARVSPAAYLPRLSDALIHLGFDDAYDERPEARLALHFVTAPAPIPRT
jgi:hypothetical protein